jgi:2-dehydro-3-deoxyphosphogalactonate aldolase
MTSLAHRLERFPFVAILRGVKPDEVEAIGDVLLEEGFEIIEVPLNSPSPLESIKRLVARIGSRALIGAGTVTRMEDVAGLAQAGGRLAVMPNADSDVVREAKRLGLIAIPGIATPTEAFAMLRAGADALKLFPAEASSPSVLAAMRAVLPAESLVLPVGGITATNFAPWRSAGAKGFGLGSALYKAGMGRDEVRRRARQFAQALAGAPPNKTQPS